VFALKVQASSTNQSWFKRLRFAEIVAVIASLLALLRLQEHWISYRATAEALKTAKFLFLTQTQPYDKEDAFHLLVQRVEALLSKESAGWIRSMTKPPEGENRA
jgi:hypothetical protein